MNKSSSKTVIKPKTMAKSKTVVKPKTVVRQKTIAKTNYDIKIEEIDIENAIRYNVLRFLIVLLAFVLLITGPTIILQKSLIIFKRYGSYIHWISVLIIVPFLSGLAVRLLTSKGNNLIILLGSISSIFILYPLYKNIFWETPPTYLEAAIFVIITAGISNITNIRRKTIDISDKPTAKKKSSTKASQGITTKSRNTKKRKKAIKLAKLKEVMEFIVASISVLLSIISIFKLAG